MGTDEPWLDDRQEALWRAWVTLSGQLPVALNRQLHDSGLSLPDFEVLVCLTDVHEGRVRLTDLATRMNWERSRVSHQVRRMCERGLIERQLCPEDARVGYVAITPKGRAAIEQAAPGHAALVRRVMFEEMTPGELAAIERVIGRALTYLDEIGTSPST